MVETTKRTFTYQAGVVEEWQRKAKLKVGLMLGLSLIASFVLLSLKRDRPISIDSLTSWLFPLLITVIICIFVYWRFTRKQLATLVSWELEIEEDQITWWNGGQLFMRLLRSEVTKIEETPKLLTLKTENKSRVFGIRRKFEEEDYQEIKQILSEWMPITTGDDGERRRTIRQVLISVAVGGTTMGFFFTDVSWLNFVIGIGLLLYLGYAYWKFPYREGRIHRQRRFILLMIAIVFINLLFRFLILFH